MAASQCLQLDLHKVKGQLLHLLSEVSSAGSPAPQGTRRPSVRSPHVAPQSPRGPSLGVSGATLQRQLHLKMRGRRTPTCRDCCSPYRVQGQTPRPLPLTPHPSAAATPRRLVASAVHSTVAAYAFPSPASNPQSELTPRPAKRRPSPQGAELKRGPRVSKRPKWSDTFLAREVLREDSYSASLSVDNLSDTSIDVDHFPLVLPTTCPPPCDLEPRIKDTDPLKALHDISSISRTSRTNLHEQPSGNESRFAHVQALHSTFDYPLHSTMNYPLHSTMAAAPMPDLDLDLPAKVTATKVSSSKCSSDSSCSCSECVAEDLEAAEAAEAAAEGLASRLPSSQPCQLASDSHLRRQTGQSQLSQPRSPVQLSQTDFLSATMLADASLDVTRDSVPGLDDVCAMLGENRRGGAGRRLQPEGHHAQSPQLRSCISRPLHHHTARSSHGVPQSHAPIYESLALPTSHDYENVARCKPVKARRRSVHDKENSSPPALPPRQPLTPMTYMTSAGHATRARYTEMDSVLSNHPGCFNLLKSSVKKRKMKVKVTGGSYDQEKKRMLVQKMKHFQRSMSGVGVSDREVTMLGQL